MFGDWVRQYEYRKSITDLLLKKLTTFVIICIYTFFIFYIILTIEYIYLI